MSFKNILSINLGRPEGMKKVIIFLGPPGSGKGTQAKIIAAKHNYAHISTGDLLRALKDKVPLSAEESDALERVEAGQLVSDELIYALVFDEIETSLARGQGVVLDGAIRNVAQAKAYQKFFEGKQLGDEVIVISVALDDDEALKRISGRRICRQCGAIVPVGSSQVRCPTCGGELRIREDDDPTILKERIRVQGNQALVPILAYYTNLGVVRSVDGGRGIVEVGQAIEKVLEN